MHSACQRARKSDFCLPLMPPVEPVELFFFRMGTQQTAGDSIGYPLPEDRDRYAWPRLRSRSDVVIESALRTKIVAPAGQIGGGGWRRMGRPAEQALGTAAAMAAARGTEQISSIDGMGNEWMEAFEVGSGEWGAEMWVGFKEALRLTHPTLEIHEHLCLPQLPNEWAMNLLNASG